MQLCDEAPKYLIVLVAIKQSTPFLRLSRVLLSLYILQIRPPALTRFCPKTSLYGRLLLALSCTSKKCKKKKAPPFGVKKFLNGLGRKADISDLTTDSFLESKAT